MYKRSRKSEKTKSGISVTNTLFALCYFLAAAQVLRRDELELEGYLLQLKEKQPELILPPDRKKLYVENINPITSEENLSNYIAVKTKQDEFDIQFTHNGNALITLKEEPGNIVNH